MYEWVTLYDRCGSSVAQPSTQQMEAALNDLFANPQDPEHFECWIECGSEDGPLHSFAVTSNGGGRITTYSDADMSEELSTETLEGLTLEAALAAWNDFVAK